MRDLAALEADGKREAEGRRTARITGGLGVDEAADAADAATGERRLRVGTGVAVIDSLVGGDSATDESTGGEEEGRRF